MFPAVFILVELESAKIMLKQLFYTVLLIAFCNASLFCMPVMSATISGDEVTLLHTSTPAQGNCPNGTYNIEISQTMYDNSMLFSQSATCTSGYRKVDFNGVTVGNEDTLCDNGYLNNGACVSYITHGYQSNFYNLDLDSNTFVEPTNDTCGSGYHATTTQPSYLEVCETARNKVYLNWGGVDVTGTPAEFCYYGDVLYAPTTEPASPPGYKFIGWIPQME